MSNTTLTVRTDPTLRKALQERALVQGKTVSQAMIIISAGQGNLDYASQAPLHPGYAAEPGQQPFDFKGD